MQKKLIVVVSAVRMTDFFREALGTESYHILTLSQGDQVLRTAQAANPALILIHDYWIEGTEGTIAFCRELRQHLQPDLPIILISFASHKDAAAALGIEWFDFMGGIELSIARIQAYLPMLAVGESPA